MCITNNLALNFFVLQVHMKHLFIFIIRYNYWQHLQLFIHYEKKEVLKTRMHELQLKYARNY